MTHRRAFLFDLDGTLADTLPDIAASTNHVRERHGLGPLELDAVRRFVGDGARALLRRALVDVLPADERAQEQALDAAFASYAEHHLEQCTRSATPYPNVTTTLATLHERGCALAVVTNKPQRFAELVVAHTGLAPFFPVVVGGDLLPTKKPDPAMLHHALAELGVRSSPLATMVGDGVQDLRAGKAAGLTTIACLYGYGLPERLRSEGADTYWRAFGTPT